MYRTQKTTPPSVTTILARTLAETTREARDCLSALTHQPARDVSGYQAANASADQAENAKAEALRRPVLIHVRMANAALLAANFALKQAHAHSEAATLHPEARRAAEYIHNAGRCALLASIAADRGQVHHAQRMHEKVRRYAVRVAALHVHPQANQAAQVIADAARLFPLAAALTAAARPRP